MMLIFHKSPFRLVFHLQRFITYTIFWLWFAAFWWTSCLCTTDMLGLACAILLVAHGMHRVIYIRKGFGVRHPVGSFATELGLLSQSIRSVILQFFQHCQNTRHLLNITFIYDRCRYRWAAVAPVKYKYDVNYLWGTFCDKKIAYGEINERIFLATTFSPFHLRRAW